MHAHTNCPRCDYELVGLAGRDRCPECGVVLKVAADARMLRGLDGSSRRWCRRVLTAARGALWTQLAMIVIAIVAIPIWVVLSVSAFYSGRGASQAMDIASAVFVVFLLIGLLGPWAVAGHHASRVAPRHASIHPLAQLGEASRWTPVIAFVLSILITSSMASVPVLPPFIVVCGLAMLGVVIAAPTIVLVMWMSCMRRMIEHPAIRRRANTHDVQVIPAVEMIGLTLLMIAATLVVAFTPYAWLAAPAIAIWFVIISIMGLSDASYTLELL